MKFYASHLSFSSSIFFFFHSTTFVDGHASLTDPFSRQYYAFKEGKRQHEGEIAHEFPAADSAPYGFQAGGYDYGACGRRRFDDLVDDYTFNYVTAFGNPVPWKSQATYVRGQDIEIEVTVQANHGGYHEFSLCTDYENPTQECFDENIMMFVEDNYYGGPIDSNYPTRGYFPPSGVSGKVANNGGDLLIRHTFRLPDDIVGEKVLMQWHWVSVLGCKPAGYLEYDFPDSWSISLGNKELCEYDSMGRLPSKDNLPQQYWQCSEITILDNDTEPSALPPRSPSMVPSESAMPSTKSPSTTPTQLTPSSTIMPTPPFPSAMPIGPLPSTLPSIEPSEMATKMPVTLTPVGDNGVKTTGVPCCTQNFRSCINNGNSCNNVGACEISQACTHLHWLELGEPVDPNSCAARWSGCANKPCCPGMVCALTPWGWQGCYTPEDALNEGFTF